MKFLLVGFSEQAQNALELLLTREFTGHSYYGVPRQLSSFLYPICPKISAEILEQYDTCIVDLDGIGMMNFDEKYRDNLLSLIHGKTAILISRQIKHSWSESVPLWTNKHIEYISQPYTKDDMSAALHRLIEGKAQSIPETELPSYINLENGTTSVFQEKLQLSEIAYRMQFTEALLMQRFAKFEQNPVFKHLLTVFSCSKPFRLEVSQHELLVIPEKNMVLVAKVQSIIDYFSLLKSFKLSTFHIVADPIGNNLEKQEKEFIKKGARPYQLGLFLWQIYQEVIPEDIELNQENLRLKMAYMPDFSSMNNVPTYMNSVVSSCLYQAQDFTRLRRSFPFLSISNLNRVFILAVLCNYAEIESFEPSIQFHAQGKPQKSELSQPVKMAVEPKNKQVVKARKAGLLERLLAKLDL